MRRFLLATTATAVVLSAQGVAQAQTSQSEKAGAQTQSAAPAVRNNTSTEEHRFAFSDEDRVIMRRYVRPRVQAGVTTGSAPGTVTVGERVPESLELRSFPAAVYRESPRLGAYRYIDLGGRAYVVDPRERIIVEEID
jgi:hypothetical protein